MGQKHALGPQGLPAQPGEQLQVVEQSGQVAQAGGRAAFLAQRIPVEDGDIPQHLQAQFSGPRLQHGAELGGAIDGLAGGGAAQQATTHQVDFLLAHRRVTFPRAWLRLVAMWCCPTTTTSRSPIRCASGGLPRLQSRGLYYWAGPRDGRRIKGVNAVGGGPAGPPPADQGCRSPSNWAARLCASALTLMLPSITLITALPCHSW